MIDVRHRLNIMTGLMVLMSFNVNCCVCRRPWTFCVIFVFVFGRNEEINDTWIRMNVQMEWSTKEGKEEWDKNLKFKLDQ